MEISTEYRGISYVNCISLVIDGSGYNFNIQQALEIISKLADSIEKATREVRLS